MPWVNEEICTGCGVCLEECPVGAMTIQENSKAHIKAEDCIRCGQCHDICPEDAVRHDSERIPMDVEANLAKVKRLLKHYDTEAEQEGFLERMRRYFNKERKVSEQTAAAIEKLKTELELMA